ncbi:MAG: PEP-CTERM sorting domain-containing protein [Alphaproteobacteria bacterium]|nr:PEP-CTERM sorting domain-containing protein [Alphaproteobacteria bacterium]
MYEAFLEGRLIALSTSPISEPATWLLLTIGLAATRRLRRRRG